MIEKIDILGVEYTVSEVDVVNKEELRKGEINFLTNEIRIDKGMPGTLKEQVLMHEMLAVMIAVVKGKPVPCEDTED